MRLAATRSSISAGSTGPPDGIEGMWNTSVQCETSFLYDRYPDLHFICQQLCKIRRRARLSLEADPPDRGPQFLRLQAFVDRGIELCNDVRGRPGRAEQAVRGHRRHLRQAAFRHGRYIRQFGVAFGAGHGESAELALANERRQG